MDQAARTLKLTVEYDGTDFFGYQSQGAGERTVQSVLQETVSRIVDQPVILHAAGRTDTGVHALGQIVSFQTTGKIPTQRLAIALNSSLPRDLAVARAEDAPDGFHARFSARSRTYGYLLSTRRARSAVWGRYSLHCRRPLDRAAMRAAGATLVGTHDFAAYARGGGSPGPTTVRDLTHLSIRRFGDDRLLVIVTANGFLRTMVRNIVGVMVAVGVGDLEPGAAREILDTRSRTLNPVAPAAPHGLFLMRVQY
ncbi:MAG: tRNA pseudouridine(38-40) synthase TruA [Capsulimonas sp.]|uniref:tRNA pseudouridine(38-40) synthase TruA n=1 Tax=Capsulimonas sp. TaxID=2494211 RepID=UPI003263BFE8